MIRFRTLLALCLAALWLPATQHCDLEAAGVLAESCAGEDGAGCDETAADSCKTIEGSAYQASVAVIKVAPRLLAVAESLPHLALLVPLADVEKARPPRPRRPEDWIPVWQFERRAAALAHAPDSLSA
jgi:hypothetical protein